MQLNSMRKRVGFTLIEMMIALVITMMMVFAMVEAFQWIGEATTTGRAQIEMAGQLRAARYRLELDLNGVTVPMRPWGAKNADHGYFELIEGTASDNNPSKFVSPAVSGYMGINFTDPNDNLAAQSKSMFGDLDDILMFTARNDHEPFRGRYVTLDAANQPQTIIIESNLAEIIWWAELNDTKPDPDPTIIRWDPGETFTIRRRVLLVRPDLVDPSTGSTTLTMYNTAGVIANNDALAVAKFLDVNDISIHPLYDNNYVITGYAPNTLADLSLRHNRVAHWGLSNQRDAGSNPQYLGLSNTGVGPMLSPIRIEQDFFPSFRSTSNHFGEDVILTNVTAFDFRVWDPLVPIVADAGGLNEALIPGDPGYNTQFQAAVATPTLFVGQGAYVDLGGMTHELNPPANPTNATVLATPAFSTRFMGAMASKAQLGNSNSVYDPWTMAYERDGFNQDGLIDGNSDVDEGTDGLDSLEPPATSTTLPPATTLRSGPDDAAERETSPPYPYPLKSIRVSIRMYEPDTRQIRQSTHEMSFSE